MGSADPTPPIILRPIQITIATDAGETAAAFLPERSEALSKHTRAIIAITAILPFAILAVDGANSAVPSAISATASFLLTALVVATMPTMMQWRRDVAVALAALTLACVMAMVRALVFNDGMAISASALQVSKILGFAALTVTGLVIAGDIRRSRLLVSLLAVAGGSYVLLAVSLGRPVLAENVPEILNGRFGGTLLNANAAATVFAVVAVLCVAQLLTLLRMNRLYLFRPQDVGLIITVGGIILLAVAAIVMTRARTAAVMTIIAAVAIIVRDARQFGLPRAARLTIAGVSVAILAALLTFGGEMIARFPTLWADAAERVASYRHLLAVVGEAPFWGHGFGTFIEVNTTHLNPARVTTMWNWGASHNLMLDALIEGGLAFAVPMTICLLTIGVAIARPGPRPITGSGYAAAVAVGVILVSAIVDIALNIPGVAALAALLLGIAWGDRLLHGEPFSTDLAEDVLS